MWKLLSEKDGKRKYSNSATGSKCETQKLYTDKDGNDWYGFTDLLAIPYTRSFAATKISALYALGLSKDDLFSHIGTLKQILRSEDVEKYEKAYARVIDFEAKAQQATDPLKQMSSLVCVYYLLSEEAIDVFDNNLQLKKIAILEADFDLHAFFLSKQIQATEDYTKRLKMLSTIVSPLESPGT